VTIIDASLAAKLFIKESDSENARVWFSSQNEPITAPDLLAIEVAQAIVRRVNAREVRVSDGKRLLSAWRNILENDGIFLLQTSVSQVAEAAELAIGLGHPIKDCIYLAAAIEQQAILMTCDAKFAARARTIYADVKLLSELPADGR
jgi:predicted nucleic acid-binding protein